LVLGAAGEAGRDVLPGVACGAERDQCVVFFVGPPVADVGVTWATAAATGIA
jgi:hypothetical protein